MSEPIEHINKIQREIHLLNRQGHITEANEFSAVEDLQIALHRLRQAFEWNGKTKDRIQNTEHRIQNNEQRTKSNEQRAKNNEQVRPEPQD